MCSVHVCPVCRKHPGLCAYLRFSLTPVWVLFPAAFILLFNLLHQADAEIPDAGRSAACRSHSLLAAEGQLFSIFPQEAAPRSKTEERILHRLLLFQSQTPAQRKRPHSRHLPPARRCSPAFSVIRSVSFTSPITGQFSSTTGPSPSSDAARIGNTPIFGAPDADFSFKRYASLNFQTFQAHPPALTFFGSLCLKTSPYEKVFYAASSVL